MSRQKPWQPTPEQRTTAYCLADGYVGAYVQTRPDGSADLRTVEQGALRHYLISRDGAATLVTAGVRTWRHPIGYLLLITGGFGAVAMIVTLILIQIGTERGLGWAMWLLGTAIALAFVGQELLDSQPRPPGEFWEQLGGAEY